VPPPGRTRAAAAPRRPTRHTAHRPSCPPPSRRHCSLCGTAGRGLLRCSRCKSAWYCNASCQKRGWNKHKPDCKPAGGAAPSSDQASAAAAQQAGSSAEPGSPHKDQPQQDQQQQQQQAEGGPDAASPAEPEMLSMEEALGRWAGRWCRGDGRAGVLLAMWLVAGLVMELSELLLRGCRRRWGRGC
jgi:hypothetical protein